MDEVALSLEWLASRIDEVMPTCAWCGAVLRGSQVRHYGPHEGGYLVEGYQDKRWVYVTCTGCGYDWALHKIWGDLK